MREYLTKNLEPIIWTWCGISILSVLILSVGMYDAASRVTAFAIFGSLYVAVGGISLILILTGIFFNILDIRTFSRHSAVALHKSRGEGIR